MTTEISKNPTKSYLGDGCYATFDGFAFELLTENGIETTNRVYLEPEVFRAMIDYVRVRTGKYSGRYGIDPQEKSNAS